MLAVAFYLSAAFAALVTVAAILKAALEANPESKAMAESLSFVRMSLTGIFGVTIGQSLVPLGMRWWLTAIISVALMVALLILTQLAAKRAGHAKFGQSLLKWLSPLVNSIHLLFTPLSLPKVEEPEEFEQEMLESVEELSETWIREVMVPRVEMATLASDSTLAEAMEFFAAKAITRAPVTGKSVDEVVGVLYLKDLVRAIHGADSAELTQPVTKVARKAIFMPESLPLDDLLQAMREQNTHIVIVVDEYGGVAGLVTLEDVTDELVGEITDANEADQGPTPLDDGGYRVAAKYSLFDLGDLFEIELEEEDVDSVGGLMTKQLERLPNRGDVVAYSGLIFTAEQFEGRHKRMKTVLVHRDQELADAAAAFEGLEQ
ncbi:MAG: hemolysin family protein [Micrococcales bacterium]